MHGAPKPESMSFEDLTYHFDSDLATAMDEMYWERQGMVSHCDEEALFNMLLRWAQAEGITVTDADTVDYETLLYDIWQNTEKGLS